MVKNWTCVFMLFYTCEILSSKKYKKFKTSLMTSYILLLQVYMAWQEHTVKCTVQISILRTRLNHLARLAKWLSVYLRTKWFWVRSLLQYLNFKCHARSSLTFRQLYYRVWIHSEMHTWHCILFGSRFGIQYSGFRIPD